MQINNVFTGFFFVILEFRIERSGNPVINVSNDVLLCVCVCVYYTVLTLFFLVLQICCTDIFTENSADRPQRSSAASEYHRGLSERPGRLHQKVFQRNTCSFSVSFLILIALL